MATIETSLLDDQLQSAINDSPYLLGKKLRFEHQSDRVVMTGEVGSYFQAQMAQEALRRINGIKVENRLEVTAY